jgi:hypothetical protein
MIMSSLIPNYKQIVHFCKEIGELYLIEEFNLDRQSQLSITSRRHHYLCVAGDQQSCPRVFLLTPVRVH